MYLQYTFINNCADIFTETLIYFEFRMVPWLKTRRQNVDDYTCFINTVLKVIEANNIFKHDC